LFIAVFKFVEHEKENRRYFIPRLTKTLIFIVEISKHFARIQAASFVPYLYSWGRVLWRTSLWSYSR